MRSNSIQNNQAIASIYYGYVTLLFFPESTPLYFLVSFIYYLSVTCIRTYLNGLLPSVRSNPNMVKIFVGFCSSDRSRPHACAYVVRCGNTATPTHTNPSRSSASPPPHRNRQTHMAGRVRADGAAGGSELWPTRAKARYLPPRPPGAASRTCLPACRRRRTVLAFWLRRRTACSPFGWLASAASSIRIVSKGNGGKYNCIKTDHAPREEGYYCVHQSYRTRN
jgi:hypothetical protein